MPSSVRARPNRHERVVRSFLNQVHQVLALGYARLNASTYHDAQEETITGDLVQEMTQVVEGSGDPPWMNYFVVSENVPQNTGGLKGKDRPRIDIEFRRTGRGARRRFGFEAKRLYRTDSVSVYLGDDGIGCFLSGRYVAEKAQAGMLGYVQQGDAADWAKRIGTKLIATRATHGLVGDDDDECWQPTTLYPALKYTFETRHDVKRETSLSIFHTLLHFCG